MLHDLRRKVCKFQAFFTLLEPPRFRGDSWDFVVEVEHKAVCCLSLPQAVFQRRKKMHLQQSDISTNSPDIAWYGTGLHQAATASESCQ